MTKAIVIYFSQTGKSLYRTRGGSLVTWGRHRKLLPLRIYGYYAHTAHEGGGVVSHYDKPSVPELVPDISGTVDMTIRAESDFAARLDLS